MTPLLPHNDDIYIDFLESASPQNQIIGETSLVDDPKGSFLQICEHGTGKPISNIYSERKLLLFLQFFLEHNSNIAFKLFIHQMRVPSIERLDSAFSNFQQVGHQLNIMTLELDKLIKNTFFTQLTKE